jgi:hypothetical protein
MPRSGHQGDVERAFPMTEEGVQRALEQAKGWTDFIDCTRTIRAIATISPSPSGDRAESSLALQLDDVVARAVLRMLQGKGAG